MSEWYSTLAPVDIEKVEKRLSTAKEEDEIIRIVHEYHPKGHSNLEPIKTLEEYFKYIRLTTTSHSWFRGESHEHDSFIPKLYRKMDPDKINTQLETERKYFYEFRRRSRSIVQNIEDNNYWSWYFLMQHYGGATRLLDWTTDAAVGLYMALDTSHEKTEPAIVYTLSPTVLVNYAFNDIGKDSMLAPSVLYPGEDDSDLWIANIKGTSTTIPDSPISLLPAYSDPRIVAQRSCFTLFGKRIDGFSKDEKEIVCNCCGRRIRNRIIIDGTKKNDLNKELAKIGVTSATVYPGLEGVTKELNQEFYA